MATIVQPYVFSWKHIEADSDLNRLRLVLSVLPDEQFVSLLEQRRGKGRDDYPIRPVWNAMLAGIVFQHPSAASLLRELNRNGELRHLCGFNPLLGAQAVPSDDAFGRFLAVVMEQLDGLLEIFHQLVEALRTKLPGLGEKLAVDSKAISSYGRPAKDEEKRQAVDRRRDIDADWGTKTYEGTRADGTKWEKVSQWFGYKLHLMVDAVYEMPLAFEVAQASSADVTHLMPLLEQLDEKHSELVSSVDELSADKGYDSNKNNVEPFDEYGIKPVIDKRKLWKENHSDQGPSTRSLFYGKVDSFVYDEQGYVYCICPQTEEMRELAFAGYEKERQALKYRCPAASCGVDCKGRMVCEARASVGPFGRVVRVPLQKDRRIFTPIARHTAKWKKAYARRTSVERVNSRLDCVLGFEQHTIRGLVKMKTRVTLALIVMLAMALGRIEADQAELMRSLTSPAKQVA
jgi:hypothetical protein